MDQVNYQETELWAEANALLLHAYSLTQTWPSEALDLAKELQQIVRSIVRAIPGAFKKGGITGNISLKMAGGNFAEFEALCAVAVSLGYLDSQAETYIKGMMSPVRARFRQLHQASKQHAKELMKKRASMFGGDFGDDDEDDF